MIFLQNIWSSLLLILSSLLRNSGLLGPVLWLMFKLFKFTRNLQNFGSYTVSRIMHPLWKLSAVDNVVKHRTMLILCNWNCWQQFSAWPGRSQLASIGYTCTQYVWPYFHNVHTVNEIQDFVLYSWLSFNPIKYMYVNRDMYMRFQLLCTNLLHYSQLFGKCISSFCNSLGLVLALIL